MPDVSYLWSRDECSAKGRAFEGGRFMSPHIYMLRILLINIASEFKIIIINMCDR